MSDAQDTGDERALLRDEAMKWVAGAYPEARRRAAAESPEGYDAEAWVELAGLGWLGLALPEELGGAGGGEADLAAVMEGVGAGLLPEPLLSVAGLAIPFLRRQATAVQQVQLLPELAAGRRIVVLAHQEAESGFDRDAVETRATPQEGGWRLDGAKAAVAWGGAADDLIVTARLPDDALGAFLVPRGASGLAVVPFRTIDGRRAADLRLDAVPVPAAARLGENDAAVALDEVLDLAALLAAAEAVGAMQGLVDDTVAYLKTRRQFGRLLAEFQALQHRAVDMYLGLQEARGVVEAAVRALDAPAEVRRKAIAVARIVTGRAGNAIGREAVQLHGGIGMTDALRIGHGFKRVLAATSQFGDAEWYLDRFRRLER